MIKDITKKFKGKILHNKRHWLMVLGGWNIKYNKWIYKLQAHTFPMKSHFSLTDNLPTVKRYQEFSKSQIKVIFGLVISMHEFTIPPPLCRSFPRHNYYGTQPSFYFIKENTLFLIRWSPPEDSIHNWQLWWLWYFLLSFVCSLDPMWKALVTVADQEDSKTCRKNIFFERNSFTTFSTILGSLSVSFIFITCKISGFFSMTDWWNSWHYSTIVQKILYFILWLNNLRLISKIVCFPVTWNKAFADWLYIRKYVN